jgi:hypothetical protein
MIAALAYDIHIVAASGVGAGVGAVDHEENPHCNFFAMNEVLFAPRASDLSSAQNL